MNSFLSKAQKRQLLAQHKKERDGRIRDRIKAVLAYDDGYTYSEIAKILLLDDETIRRHIKNYEESEKLKPENGGSNSHLSVEHTESLLEHLIKTTYLYVKDICAYVKKTFGIKYSYSGMTKWLKAHDFRYKKPHAVPAKADKEKQQEFISTYEALKKRAGNKEPIYFVDSVHPEHQTRLAYGWIMKGERKNIATTGRQYRLNFMGGICLNGHTIIYEQAERINEHSIQSFLYRLRKRHPGRYKVHIIWDNAGYHCSKQVQKFAQELGVEIHYLPPYSPNLNPIERLWKIMHEHVTYNRYYETFSDFTEAMRHFFRHIGKKKKLLAARINDNFQLVDAPNFAS